MKVRLLLTVFAVGLLIAADDKKAKEDKDAIQGKWKVEKFARDGEAIAELGDAEIFVTFEKDIMMIDFNGNPFEGNFKLDSKAKPKAITMDFMGEERLGIYELKDDTLKISLGEPGDDRPKSFKDAEEAGHIIGTYKRVKKEK